MNLEGLYVVRTPFKAGGNFYEAGLLLTEEALFEIKLAKIRLNERKIIPIPTEKDQLINLCDYFEIRMGVDLRAKIAREASKGSDSAEPKKPSASANPTTPGTSEKPKPLSQGKAPIRPNTEKK